MSDASSYNPLDKKNLGASVADALLEKNASPLHEIVRQRFVGAGIYVLYYTGHFPPYQVLAELNRDGRLRAPIYIGKAVPEGSRKGGKGIGGKPGFALHKRLSEHAKSIRAASGTLEINDFACRLLVVEDIWIPLGESLLITRYLPVWNMVVEGFGNHAPGGGRYEGKIPIWDVLHPGRDWGPRCKPRAETGADIIAMVEEHFATNLAETSLETHRLSDLAKLVGTSLAAPNEEDSADDIGEA